MNLVVLSGDSARLTDQGWAVANRARAAFEGGRAVEQIVDDEGLPSVRHLQFLVALAEESDRRNDAQ